MTHMLTMLWGGQPSSVAEVARHVVEPLVSFTPTQSVSQGNPVSPPKVGEWSGPVRVSSQPHHHQNTTSHWGLKPYSEVR